MKKRSRLFDALITKSWWAILFFLLSLFAYDQAVQRRNREEGRLKEKFLALQKEQRDALAHREELKSEIASQDDAAWIEMVLMRRLGLVPEGQTKIHFVTQ